MKLLRNMSPHDDIFSIFDDDNEYDERYDQLLEEYEIDKMVQGLPHPLEDFYGSPDAFAELNKAPEDSSYNWKDFSNETYGAHFSIDTSKAKVWEMAKQEINHLRKNLDKLLKEFPELCNDPSKTKEQKVILALLGSKSKVGELLMKELEMTDEQYYKWMSTNVLAAAFSVSSEQLYNEKSPLKKYAAMDKESYMEVYKKLATKNKISETSISTNRRPELTWQKLEETLNKVLKKLSIDDREGKVSIAIDDDKIAMQLSQAGSDDLFQIKYTTHVRDNRKGAVAHTAVSTGVNMPIGICFERTKDKTVDCIMRLLKFHFAADGELKLRNIHVHIDRGYATPPLVVDTLMKAGAEVR